MKLIRGLCVSMFKPVVIERKAATDFSSALATLTHAMSSFEHLVNRVERKPGGANDWSVTNNSANFRNPLTRRVVDFAAQPAVTEALHMSRLAVCVLKVLPKTPTLARGIFDLYLSVTSLVLAPRHHFGGDGSDQLSALTTALTGVARVSGSDRVADAALWGLSLQGGLAYFASGWVKIAGPRWRNGTALLGVMRTRVYGHEHFWHLLKKYPWLGLLLERTTLVLECAFPLVYFSHGRLTRMSIVSAASMHAAIVIAMALGRFFPAFSSLYPAIAYTTVPAQLLGSKRHDTTPVLVTLTTGALFFALQIDKSIRTKAARAPLPGYQMKTLPSGAEVSMQRTDHPGSEDSAAVVLVHGLGSTPALWSRAAAELKERQISTLNYDRGNFGRSEPPASAAHDGLSIEIARLVELIKEEYPGRSVILVGHSLGGLIAYRAAQQLAGQAAAVVLLDSTHPQQLDRSSTQRDMTENVTSSLLVTALLLSAGFGRLMSRPGWLRHVPPELRESLDTKARDSRTYWQAYREWQSAEDEFRRRPQAGPADFSVLSITAGDTEMIDPAVADLHRDYAEQSASGKHIVIDGFHHNDVLFGPEATETLVAQIAELVDKGGHER